jgi:hypothetical protein
MIIALMFLILYALSSWQLVPKGTLYIALRQCYIHLKVCDMSPTVTWYIAA